MNLIVVSFILSAPYPPAFFLLGNEGRGYLPLCLLNALYIIITLELI